MNVKEYKKLPPVKRKEFLATFDEQFIPHNQAIEKANAAIDKLVADNRKQIDEREAAQKACNLVPTGIICAVLFFLFILMRGGLIKYLFLIGAVAIAVVKFLAYKKHKPELDRLNEELAEFDKAEEKENEIIAAADKAILDIKNKQYEFTSADKEIEETVNSALVDVAMHKRYPYTMAVYVGGHLTGNDIDSVRADESPIAWDQYYSSCITGPMLSIDGLAWSCRETFEAGGFNNKCTLFHLEPGTHTIALGGCMALNPFESSPGFTDYACVDNITVTIDENTPFVGVAVGITLGAKAELGNDDLYKYNANKLQITTSCSEFAKITGAALPIVNAKDEFKEDFTDDVNELDVLKKILAREKGVNTRPLTFFAGHIGISERTYDAKELSFPWEEYKSSDIFNSLLVIDECFYPVVFNTTKFLKFNPPPRQYYTFNIGVGSHSCFFATQLLLLPKMLLSKEVISKLITTDEYVFENKEPGHEFTGIAFGFISTYHSDNRLIKSWIENDSKWKMCLCDGNISHDEKEFMEEVML